MITLSKLASLAHVSVSTASKAFSGSNEVNEQTREHIFKIAKENGCFKKYYNVKYPKYVIAVICPEFKSRHYSFYLTVIQNELSKHNCEICVATTDFSKDETFNLIEYYTKYANVDGIIVIDPQDDIKTEINIPMAVIGKNRQKEIITASGNTKSALCDVIKYFKEKDITKIGFIGEELTKGMVESFKSAMTENNLQVDESFIYTTNKRFEAGGYSAMKKLFERNTVPKALICAYDNMAIGAMKCIFEKALKIPEDIAVIGFNNISEDEYLTPSLSSIDSGAELACITVTKEIMNKITDKPVKYENIIPYKIYYRKSTDI